MDIPSQVPCAIVWRGLKTAIARLKESRDQEGPQGECGRGRGRGRGADGAALAHVPGCRHLIRCFRHRVNAAVEEILPILIAAPAMPKLRAAWLERLYHAVQEDGVQYLYPLEERWG